jgi:hypothetical protein
MLRARFYANPDDPRPVRNPTHPHWCTGYAADGSYSVVVAYVDSIDELMKDWPEATEIESEEVSEYIFTDRFPKPLWMA